MPLFAILIAALNSALAFLLRSVLVKFGTFFALWFITTGFIEVLQRSGVLPNARALDSAFGGLSSDMWYWLDLFAVPSGMPIIVGAAATRFIIRRLPIIG